MTISSIMMLIYVCVIVLVYGFPDSLSQSYYLLPQKWRFIFTLIMMYTSIILMIEVFPKINDIVTIILTVCGAFGIILVGFMSAFDKSDVHSKYQRIPHFVGAFFSATSTVALSVYHGLWYIPLTSLILTFGISSIFFHFKKMTFFLEMGAFLSMYISLYILLR